MKLATTYLGFKLRTPLVPSASPLSEKIDNIKRMEDAGASAVVFQIFCATQIYVSVKSRSRSDFSHCLSSIAFSKSCRENLPVRIAQLI
jgi:hypothetical protein